METSGTKKKMKTGTLVLLSILAVIVIFLIIVLIVVLPWRSAQKKMEFTLINNGTEYMVTSPNLTKSLSGAIMGGSNYGGKVVIPSEYNGLPVTVIGEGFMKSTSIKSVTIPDSIKIIGDSAFRVCNDLKSADIPNSVKTIGKYAFHGCELKDVVIPNGVETIGDYAFSSCFELESIVISNSVTHIGTEAFYRCNKLSSVTIPESVISIGYLAFVPQEDSLACEEEDGITYVDKWVVKADETITEAKLREGTVGIAKYAFDQCKALKKISIPDSVKFVCKNAFRGCTNLEYTYDKSIKYLGNDQNPYVVCMGTDDKAIEALSIKDGTRVIYGKEDSTPADNKNTTSKNNAATHTAFYECSALLEIDIPESVISIGDAFDEGQLSNNINKHPDEVIERFYTFIDDSNHIYFGDISLFSLVFGNSNVSDHLEELVANKWLRAFIYVD